MKAKAISQAGEAAHAPAARQPNLRQHILVVDDDPDIRRLNTELLRHCGYHVDATVDGADAWEAIQMDSYDLLLTDYQMPKMNGVQLIKKLRNARLTLPVIMVTAAFPQNEIDRHPELLIDACLLKPYNFDELLAVVKNVLHAHAGDGAEQAPPPNWMSQASPNGVPCKDRSP